jgi:hypothetical protein
MRDRTASRSYSPAAEEFRREHERHRDWGLAQRHARRQRQLHDKAVGSQPPGTTDARRATSPPAPSPSSAPSPVERQKVERAPAGAAADPGSLTGRGAERSSRSHIDQPGWLRRANDQRRLGTDSRKRGLTGIAADQPRPAGAPPGRAPSTADQPEPIPSAADQPEPTPSTADQPEPIPSTAHEPERIPSAANEPNAAPSAADQSRSTPTAAVQPGPTPNAADQPGPADKVRSGRASARRCKSTGKPDSGGPENGTRSAVLSRITQRGRGARSRQHIPILKRTLPTAINRHPIVSSGLIDCYERAPP